MSEKELYDDMPGGYRNGWVRWNPNKIKCSECEGTDLSWFWDNGQPKASLCNNCGLEEDDQK